VETVLADDPRLTVRLEEEEREKTEPLARIILDSRGRTPLASTCIQTSTHAPTLIATTSRASSEWMRAVEEAGAQVLVCRADASGRVEWADLLQLLGASGMASVMVEGGASVAGSLLSAGLADRVDAFVAPVFLGEGRSALSGFEVESLALAPRLQMTEHESCGDDVLLSGYLGEAAKLALALCEVQGGTAST